MTRWFIVAAMAAVAMPVSGIHAQEADSLPPESASEGGPQLGVLVGVHYSFTRVPSPGASLDLVLDSPNRLPWLSLQFLAQMVRWTVQYDPLTRRDHNYLGRVRLGLGRRPGVAVYALFEKGTAVIKTEPEYWRGRTYDKTGIGVGAAAGTSRFTTSLELRVGEANRASGSLYGSIDLVLQYRFLQTPPS